MQSSRGSCNCASHGCVNRLIALPILAACTGLAFDVGRQRRLAKLVYDAVEILLSFESDHAAPVIQQLDHFRLKFRFAEPDSRTLSQPTCRFSKRFPNFGFNLAEQ